MSLTNGTPLDIAQAARLGSRKLAVLSTDERNAALTAIHHALAQAKDEVLAANVKDLDDANKAAAGGSLSASLVKRLDLSKPGKYEDMLQGILDVRELEDPSTLYILPLPHTTNLLLKALSIVLKLAIAHMSQSTKPPQRHSWTTTSPSRG
jgi:gamma-glutamyl phosphate reductase